jgi:dGTPase
MFLEHKYLKFKGLNLTLETIDGLLKHNGPILNLYKIKNLIGLKNLQSKIIYNKSASLEAQISAISDDIAYNNHDIQDGIKAKLFNLNELIEIDFFKNIYKSHEKKIKSNNNDILIYQIIRDSINLMVKDLIKNTIKNLKDKKIKSINDVYSNKSKLVCFSNKFKEIEEEIRYFLKSKMYDNKNVQIKNIKGKKIIKKLFITINKNPRKFLSKDLLKLNKYRAIADFISGMTDRYAINLYESTK